MRKIVSIAAGVVFVLALTVVIAFAGNADSTKDITISKAEEGMYILAGGSKGEQREQQGTGGTGETEGEGAGGTDSEMGTGGTETDMGTGGTGTPEPGMGDMDESGAGGADGFGAGGSERDSEKSGM